MNLRLWFWTIITGSRFKALRLEGDTLLKNARYTEALDCFRDMVAGWPESAEGYEGMSRAYRAMGLGYESRREATIAESLKTLEAHPDDLKARVALVECLMDKSMFGWAAAHAEHALRVAPKDFNVMKVAALAYRRNRNHHKAIDVLRDALRVEPLNGELYDALTFSLRASGLHAEAMRTGALAEALKELKENPNDAEAVATAVRQFDAVGFPRLALQLVEDCISKGAEHPGVLVLRAGLLLREHNSKDAISSLRLAVEKDPTYAEAHRRLAHCYNLEGERDKSQHHQHLAQTLEEAKKAGDPLITETIIIRVLLELEYPEKAHKRVLELAAKHPDNWRVLFTQGVVARYEGHLQEAQQYLLKAMHYNSMSSELHMEMANLHSEAGEVMEAVSEARRAVKLDPRNPDVRRMLAAILRRHGFMDQAVEEDELADAIAKASKSRG